MASDLVEWLSHQLPETLLMAVKPVSSDAPYSTAIMKRQITCQTEEAKGFLGNKLNSIAVALFILDVTTRKRIARLNLSPKEHRAASKALNKLFTDFEQDIQDETARIETVLKAQKVDGRAQHNNPGTSEVEITTPELKRVVDILLAFDNLMVLTDTVWLMGFMDTEDANQFRKQKAAQFKRLISSVYKLSQAAKQSAAVKDDAEAQAAIAREEEKLEATGEATDAAPPQEPKEEADSAAA